MTAMHLDARVHSELLAGSLDPRDAAALADHLAGDCAACEAFLAQREEADALDGSVDLALAALARRGAAAPAGEFEAIDRRVRAAGGARRPGRAGRRWAWPALAAAAGVAVAGVAALVARTADPPARPAWDGTKGAGSVAVPVRLRFVVVEDGRGGPLRRGASGEAVGAGASLHFEVELGATSHVALVRVPPGGAPEVFWQGALGAGPSSVSVGGQPAAYRLEGLRGVHRFVAVASGAPLAPEEAARAAAEATAAEGRRPDAGLGADAVEVRIE